MESPPKRVTRARAAAGATNSTAGTRSTKIITAAAKARSAPSAFTASTRSTAAKRKTRADEDDGDQESDNENEMTAKPTRGRPRKAAEPSSAATSAARTTRGRPAKKLATEASREAAAAPAAARATRGRPRKDAETTSSKTTTRATTATTRARSGTTSRNEASSTTRPAVKKSVKFADPEGKENIEPSTKKEANNTTAASIRGRPARRGGAAAASATTAATGTRRAIQGSSSKDVKKPLSPRKVTQMPLQRDEESEDELAGPSQPATKPMKKSPVKPPSGSVVTEPTPSSGLSAEDQDEDATTTVNMAILNPPNALGSPAKRLPSSVVKDTMRSPARKMGAVPFPSASALKSATKISAAAHGQQTSPSKNSLLFSAAKRPPSPIKGLSLNFSSPSKPSPTKASMLHSPAKRAMPGVKPQPGSRLFESAQDISETPAMKPPIVSTPAQAEESSPSEKLLTEQHVSQSEQIGASGEVENEENEEEEDEEEPFQEPIRKINFPGRLSAVMPRETDPSFTEAEDEHGLVDEDEVDQILSYRAEDTEAVAVPDHDAETAALADGNTREQTETVDTEVEGEDLAVQDDTVLDAITVATAGCSPTPSEATAPVGASYQLREKDLNPYDDGMDVDSDNEPASPKKAVYDTPSVRKSMAGIASGRRSTIGLTSLAEQFGSWETASPDPLGATNDAKVEHMTLAAERSPAVSLGSSSTPSASHFFEDEMESHVNETDGIIFDDVALDKEDIALAQEADEMAGVIEAPEEQIQNQSFGDSLSDASQEYGDENQVPIDPAILQSSAEPVVTPIRPQRQHCFNTTTKVPLKPSDDSVPSPLEKRSFSVSKLPPQRSGGLTRSVTTPNLSSSKSNNNKATESGRRASAGPSSPSRAPPPTTPTRSSVDLVLETPGRVRPDTNPALLRGAVVFVDVHTTEGADASSIFVELLTQMGARCRKTWDWTPSTDSSGDSSSSNKVGITHVVYKDGGKRTLQKVRQTQGLVQCVGVSWVLDCERENEWLDEGPYYIDTSNVPRGGGRRRKSMEPKALTNLNGTLVSSPNKGGGVGSVKTPKNRRDSTEWMRTPSDQGDGDRDDIEWSQFILTPVPKTPAPEAVAKYAADICDTLGDDDDYGDETTTMSPTKESLMMRTCPPKRHTSVFEMGDGLVSRDGEDQVMRRLLAARRKSMQFAPKIASPLSKTWK